MNHTKLLTLVLLLCASVLVSCGSGNQASPSNNTQAAQNYQSSDEVQILALTQAQASVNLKHEEKETVFQTQSVPSLCTRTVQQGSRQECENENRQDCRNVSENVCRNVSTPVCQNVPRSVCQNESENVCSNVPTQECHSENQCTTVNDSVCHGSPAVCQTVPRRECHAVQQCHSVNHQQCHLENHQVCRVQNDSVCHNENHNVCEVIMRQECRPISTLNCHQVPVMGQEQYSCMQNQQVAVGERVTRRQTANIQIQVRNLRNQNTSLDSVRVILHDGRVELEMMGNPILIYQIQEVSQSIVPLNETDEVINASFVIHVL